MTTSEARLPDTARRQIEFECAGGCGGLVCRLTLEFEDTTIDPPRVRRYEHSWSVPCEALDAKRDLDTCLIARRFEEEQLFVERIESRLAASRTHFIRIATGRVLRVADRAISRGRRGRCT